MLWGKGAQAASGNANGMTLTLERKKPRMRPCLFNMMRRLRRMKMLPTVKGCKSAKGARHNFPFVYLPINCTASAGATIRMPW